MKYINPKHAIMTPVIDRNALYLSKKSENINNSEPIVISRLPVVFTFFIHPLLIFSKRALEFLGIEDKLWRQTCFPIQ